MEDYSHVIERLREYNPDELFYRQYYETKQTGDLRLLKQFLDGLDKDELIKRKLLCPDLFDMFQEFHITDQTIRSEDEQMDLDYNIQPEKHNRYAPFYYHAHNFFEIFYVLEGSCHHEIGGKETVLPRGTLCFIAPQTIHGIGVFDDSIVLYVFIHRSTFEDIFYETLSRESVLSDFFLSGLFCSSDFTHMIFHPNDNELENLLLSMFEEDWKRDEYTNRILNSTMSIFFAKLVRKYGQTAELYRNDEALSRSETMLLSYINQNYKTVTLSSLAEHFHYAPEHCSRLIKKATGKTFSAILKEIRLHRAETLLLTTNMSINEVSLACGFEYPTTFNALFKNQYHMPPGKFREEHRYK